MEIYPLLKEEYSLRSPEKNEQILDFLKSVSPFDKLFQFIPSKHLDLIIRSCKLQEFCLDRDEHLAHIGEFISECFFFIDIDEKFCNLMYKSPGVGEHFLFGKEVFEGKTKWSVNVVIPSNCRAIFCTISVSLLLQYLGYCGDYSRECSELFWRYSRLHHFLSDSSQRPIYYSRLQEGLLEPFSSHKLISSGRIHVIPAGGDIFKQGEPRTFLFFIIQGECVLLRKLRGPVADAIDIPEVDLSVHYLSGDFVFMDSESMQWMSGYESRVSYWNQSKPSTRRKSLTMVQQANFISLRSNTGLFEGDVPNFLEFGKHKNSLYALTRVEVLAVPLSEIAKNKGLFLGLLELSARKYPQSLLFDHEVAQAYENNQLWQEKRVKIIKQVVRDHFGSKLPDFYTLSTDSYVNRDYCNRHSTVTRTALLCGAIEKAHTSSVEKHNEMVEKSPIWHHIEKKNQSSQAQSNCSFDHARQRRQSVATSSVSKSSRRISNLNSPQIGVTISPIKPMPIIDKDTVAHDRPNTASCVPFSNEIQSPKIHISIESTLPSQFSESNSPIRNRKNSSFVPIRPQSALSSRKKEEVLDSLGCRKINNQHEIMKNMSPFPPSSNVGYSRPKSAVQSRRLKE